MDLDNRNYITFIKTICGNRSVIPPLVIIKGTVLLEKHFKNNIEDDTFIAITPISYINNTLSFL